MRSKMVLFLITALVTATATWQQPAEALYRRMSGATCVSTGGAQYSVDKGLFNSSALERTYYCGFPSDSHFAYNATQRINAHITDDTPHYHVDVTACAHHWSGQATSCGVTMSTSDLGRGDVTLSLTGAGAGQALYTWNSTSNLFPYLLVRLPGGTFGDLSGFRGYIAQDTL